MKYNAVLRKFPDDHVEGCKGNQYATTIHAIVSAIKKLKDITKLPDDRYLFRGAANMIVSDKFMVHDKFGVLGVSSTRAESRHEMAVHATVLCWAVFDQSFWCRARRWE